jgi:prepilin peptidase CpaA
MIKDLLLLTLFPGAMALAATTDLLTMTVPNRIVITLVAGFFLLAPLVGFSWSDIGIHAAIGCSALILGFVMFSLGWIGGGDAKLFAATALWLDPNLLLDYSLVAALFGGLLSLTILVIRHFPLPTVLLGQGWLVRLHDAKQGVPYGIALAIGGLMVYPDTPFMAALGS